MPLQRFTFKKDERLKSRKLIEQLFNSGKTFSIFPFRILYQFPEKSNAPLQSGFSASSKTFKKAVDRNRIKRIMREGYRLQKNDLTQALKKSNKYMSVFFIYKGNDISDAKEVSEKIKLILKRLNKIVDEECAANT